METPEQHTERSKIYRSSAMNDRRVTIMFGYSELFHCQKEDADNVLCELNKLDGMRKAEFSVLSRENAELIKQNSEALTAYNRECERNDELQKEIDRLKGTIGVECVKQLIAAREENKLYREALAEIVNAQTNANTIEETSVAFDFLQSSLNSIVSKFQPKKDEYKN